MQDANVKVTSALVKHPPVSPAFAFRFDAADRSIVISGDTAPTKTLVEQAKGCDVLIHEVYSVLGFETRLPVWQKYHASFHTSSIELAEMATKAKPGLLILYHQLLWGVGEKQLLNEVRGFYDGKVVSAKDLDVF